MKSVWQISKLNIAINRLILVLSFNTYWNFTITIFFLYHKLQQYISKETATNLYCVILIFIKIFRILLSQYSFFITNYNNIVLFWFSSKYLKFHYHNILSASQITTIYKQRNCNKFILCHFEFHQNIEILQSQYLIETLLFSLWFYNWIINQF